MHDTIVKMKDGRELRGALHYFRPKWGWMSLFAGPDHLINRGLPIPFRLMESAITLDERLSIHVVGDCDEIARAREHGWNPDADPVVVREGVPLGTHAVAVDSFPEVPVDDRDDPGYHPCWSGIHLAEQSWKRDGAAAKSMLVRARSKVGTPLEEGEVCTVAQAGTRHTWEMIFSRMEGQRIGWFWAREEKLYG